SVYQRKVLDLDRKIRHFSLRSEAFTPPLLRPDSAREDLQAALRQQQELAKMHPPLAVPNAEEKTWQAYPVAATHDWVMRSVAPERRNPALVAFNEILYAYAEEDAAALNRAVYDYLDYL